MTSSVRHLGAPPAPSPLQPTLFPQDLPEAQGRPAGWLSGVWAPAGGLCAQGAGEHPGSPALGSGDCPHAQPQGTRALLAPVGPQAARDVM